jgi:hypothetical protein
MVCAPGYSCQQRQRRRQQPARTSIGSVSLHSSLHLYVLCSAAGGVKGSEHVTELHSREDLDRFVSSQEERVLTVVNLSISSADPCIHIFPAVLALARSFKGYAAFGR